MGSAGSLQFRWATSKLMPQPPASGAGWQQRLEINNLQLQDCPPWNTRPDPTSTASGAHPLPRNRPHAVSDAAKPEVTSSSSQPPQNFPRLCFLSSPHAHILTPPSPPPYTNPTVAAATARNTNVLSSLCIVAFFFQSFPLAVCRLHCWSLAFVSFAAPCVRFLHR